MAEQSHRAAADWQFQFSFSNYLFICHYRISTPFSLFFPAIADRDPEKSREHPVGSDADIELTGRVALGKTGLDSGEIATTPPLDKAGVRRAASLRSAHSLIFPLSF